MLVNVLYTLTASPCRFYVAVEMSDPLAHTYYGAPQTVWIHYNISEAGYETVLLLYPVYNISSFSPFFVLFEYVCFCVFRVLVSVLLSILCIVILG